MKVLQLISSLGFFGAENVLLEISKVLHKEGFCPIVGVIKNKHNPHTEVAAEAQKNNLPTILFPCKGKVDFKTIAMIRSFIKGAGVDLIHTHNYKSNSYAILSSMGLNIPLITTCHNWILNSAKLRLYKMLDAFFLKRFDKIIAVSELVKEDILKNSISPDKVVTIFNGVDIDKFENVYDIDYLRKEFGIRKQCKVIGTVGRISKEKGHIYLLEAAKQIKRLSSDIVFLIVGDGPLKEDIVKRFSQPFIIFTGIRTDMPAIYSLIDIFVLPSLNEGMPMVLLEAMVSKKPVVATKVGAIHEVVEDMTSGLLVEPGDIKGLADSVLFLLQNDEKAKQMGARGSEMVKKRLSSSRMANDYIKVYEDILTKSGA